MTKELLQRTRNLNDTFLNDYNYATCKWRRVKTRRERRKEKKLLRERALPKAHTHAQFPLNGLCMCFFKIWWRKVWKKKSTYVCVNVCTRLHISSPKFERREKSSPGNVIIYETPNTRARTRIHTRILRQILTKRFRWVGLFVKFVLSQSRRCRRELLSALALCVCSRHLQLHSEQSWPRFWCRKLFRSVIVVTQI